MELTVDQDHLGTPETAWQQSERLAVLPPLDLGRPRRVLVIAPHPDDEVLGAGGLLQTFIAARVPVEVLAVTDGESSHPRGSIERTRNLRAVRARESLLALRRLGCKVPTIERLRVPDGQVARHEDRLCDALKHRRRAGDLWLAPWWRDGHPDHDVCGRIASAVADKLGVRSLHFLVWAWHWADPEREDLPWEQCRRVDLDRLAVEAKRWSIEAFDSQIRPLGPNSGDAPVLPPAVLSRFQRSFEVFVEGGADQ